MPQAEERSAPITLRRADDGTVAVRIFDCGNPDIERFDVSYWSDGGWSPDDPEVWRVTFVPAAPLREVNLGTVPPGGRETVAWPDGGLATIDAEFFAVEAWYADGGVEWNGFRLADIQADRITFDGDEYTPADFADIDPCDDSAG